MKLNCCKGVRHSLILSVFLFSTFFASSQGITVTGKITDEKAEPMSGVTVTVKGTSTSKTTDDHGSFSIIAPKANSTLVFSSVGFIGQDIALSGRQHIDVSLLRDNEGLGEVVVVGYGSQIRKAVTGAVQTVQAKELRDIPVAQLTQKLQGRLAGVQINQVTG
jgi:hypothetical protein